MRLFHLSDLHIGKQLHRYNLAAQQEGIFQQIVAYADRLHPDAIIIAGDIYDKETPSGEAVLLFDRFLTDLSGLCPQIPVLIISGNHDSPKRMKYVSSLLEHQKIYIAAKPPVTPDEYLQKVTLQDEHGDVIFYLMPFVRPQAVRNVFEDKKPENCDEAVRFLIERENIDLTKRNVLISHQFYTAGSHIPTRSDSETVYVGGIDNVDIDAVRMFDYVALGHIHGAQSVKESYIRYCGAPLKYSVSEWKQEKGLTVVTLGEKQEKVKIEVLPLHPGRDVLQKKGVLSELLLEEATEDFVSVTLTDESELYRPGDFLEQIFPNLLEVRVENSRTKMILEEPLSVAWESDPYLAFSTFFKEMQGRDMNEEESEVLRSVIHGTKEDADEAD